MLRVTTLVPLLFCSVNSSVGWWGHGRVGDDGSLSPLPHHPWPRRTRGYLALSFRAPLLSGPLFCRLFFFFVWVLSKFISSFIFHIGCIVCGDVESNSGPGSDKRVLVLFSNIRVLHVNLDELAVARSDYDVLVCAESKVLYRRHLSELHIPGYCCPQQWQRNSTPGAQSLALYFKEGLSSLR